MKSLLGYGIAALMVSALPSVTFAQAPPPEEGQNPPPDAGDTTSPTPESDEPSGSTDSSTPPEERSSVPPLPSSDEDDGARDDSATQESETEAHAKSRPGEEAPVEEPGDYRAPDASPSMLSEENTTSLHELDLVSLLGTEVTTATKTAESADNAPAIITVVTREMIRRWGYRSVAEVLQHVVGFYMIDNHTLPNAGVRGVPGGLASESGNIKVMIDGRSVAFRSTSGNWLGQELIPLNAVKQIEIIRGPASALYGADAFLGVVNVITLSPEEIPTADALIGTGVDGKNPGGYFDVVGGHAWERFDILLGAAGEKRDRSGLELPLESPAWAVPDYNEGKRTTYDLHRDSVTAMARLGYRGEGGGHAVLSGYVSALERGGDFATLSQLTAADGREDGSVTKLGQMRLNLDTFLPITDTLGFAVAGTYSQGEVLPGDRTEVMSDLYYVRRYYGYRGVDGLLEARWTPTTRFNLIVGGEALYDEESFPTPEFISKETGESIGPPQVDDKVELTNVGVYASANAQVIERYLKLTAGVRNDHHSIYGNQPSGRAGLIATPRRDVTIKTLYGSAFKAPSPYLLYAKPLRPSEPIGGEAATTPLNCLFRNRSRACQDISGNDELRPQTVHTAEGQVAYRPIRYFHVSSGVAYSVLLDKAEFTPQTVNQIAQNVAQQRIFSWETRVDSTDTEHYSSYATFEMHRGSRTLGDDVYGAEVLGNELPGFPSFIARFGLAVELPLSHLVPTELATEQMLVGPRNSSDSSTLAAGEPFTLEPYFMLDASIRLHDLYIVPGHESAIAIRAKNLTGERGPDPGETGYEYPLRAREFFLELRHSL